MKTRELSWQLMLAAVSVILLQSAQVAAEGSRSLHPASYPAAGARSNLDLQPGQRYMDRVVRRGFNYV